MPSQVDGAAWLQCWIVEQRAILLKQKDMNMNVGQPGQPGNAAVRTLKPATSPLLRLTKLTAVPAHV